MLLGKPQQDDAVEMAAKYLNGGLFVRDSLVTDILKKVNPKDMDAGILQLLSGVALIVFKHSNISKRFIKMLVLLNYNAAFDSLYNIMKSEAHGEGLKIINTDLQTIISELGIPEELLAAWMGNRCAQNDDEFKDVLIEKISENRDAVKKAADLTDRWGSAYLNRLLLENESDNEGLKLMEDSLMEVLEKFFIDLNVPKPVYTDYLEYLRGTRPASVIRDSITKLFGGQRIQYYYYENIFKKLSWFKNISPIYLRCICLFMYGGHFDIVTRIIEYGMDQKDKNDFSKHIEIINRAGVEKVWLVSYATEYACGQYYGNYVKPAKAYLNELLQTDRDGVVKAIPGCSANAYSAGEINQRMSQRTVP